MRQLSWLDEFEAEANRNAHRDPFAHDAAALVTAYRDSVLHCEYWLTVKDVLDSKTVKLDRPRDCETVANWVARKKEELATSNVEHDRRTAALSPGVRVDGPVGPHTQEK